MKDLAHGLEAIAPDLHLAIFWHEIKIQNYFVISIVKFKFELAYSLVLGFFIFAHVHEETLTQPFDVASVSLYASEFDEIGGLGEFFFGDGEFPEFREGYLEPLSFVHLR